MSLLPERLAGRLTRRAEKASPALLSSLFSKVMQRVVKCQVLYTQTAQEAAPHADAEANVLEVRLDQIDRLNFHENPTGSEKTEERLSNGERFFCIIRDGKVAAYAWASERRTLGFSYVGHSLLLPAQAIYIYDCYTARAFRGQNFYRELILNIAGSFPNVDKYIACRAHNKPSMRGIEKAGFQELRRFYTVDLRMFRVKFTK